MILPALVATAMLLAACSLVACDWGPAERVLYAVQRWRRRRRHLAARRRSCFQ